MPSFSCFGLIASAALLAASVAPAEANEIVSTTGHTENCIEFSQNYAECSGKSSGVCSDANSFGGTMAGMAQCPSAELQFWETKMAGLVSATEAISASSSKAEASAFTKMQKTWINFRGADCEYNSVNYAAEDAAIGIPLRKINITA